MKDMVDSSDSDNIMHIMYTALLYYNYAARWRHHRWRQWVVSELCQVRRFTFSDSTSPSSSLFYFALLILPYNSTSPLFTSPLFSPLHFSSSLFTSLHFSPLSTYLFSTPPFLSKWQTGRLHDTKGDALHRNGGQRGRRRSKVRTISYGGRQARTILTARTHIRQVFRSGTLLLSPLLTSTFYFSFLTHCLLFILMRVILLFCLKFCCIDVITIYEIR